MPTPSISLVAYHCTPEKVFVRVPNERGRFVLTDRCVVEVECTHCGAAIGEPCFRESGGRGCPASWRGTRRYLAGTHWTRRTSYQRRDGQGHATRYADGAKPRVRAEDLAITDGDPEA